MVHAHSGTELDGELEIWVEAIDDGRTRLAQEMRYRSMAFRPVVWVLERTVMKRSMQRDFEEMILPNFRRIAEPRVVTA